ncbi:catalase [Tissierella creatinophila]|uniref:Catalase n=2 Tax=Tissierella creatinophila TaxID=79681 RepID=A0A1U7M5T0_TISCR|nr:catalase [Tissierella creatinophila]OLS02610.1 catalase [Tissierella creatinophila DSM 6911]
MDENKYQHEKVANENPMDKNGLGNHLPSRNQTIGDIPEIKTATGAPVTDNQDTMTAGKRGPVALEDIWFLEKMAHFDREVIPERRMHAKGSGAFGTFRVIHDITKYTKASIFSEIGKETKMLARFSTVAGERGAADAERDIRGFALKFYTDEGNWDMVGNNTPVFFFRDPLKFIDLNHAIKRDPRTNMRSPNSNWDFWSSLPEALLQITIIMGDRGIPSSYRHMHGFSSHAYSFINKENERVWVKFHFRSQQGILNLTDQEAKKVVGMDRESHQRDLYEAIEKKIYPKWKMYVQIMTQEQADSMKNNPFDLTKMWLKKDFPLMPVGEFELNENPANYFAEIEQAAFNPAHTVPGISFSPDRMLQGRLFSYGDAQRYRLGVNHHQIPVNMSKGVENPHSFHRDGKMRVDGNLGSELHYEPNSYGNWEDNPKENLPKEKGGDVYRYDFRKDDSDYFTQPGLLFRAMTKDQQQVLFDNTARNMGDSTLQIKHRHIYHCYKADPEYGKGVAKSLNISIDDVDLNLPPSDSKENLKKANNLHPELNIPTKPVDPGREIHTNTEPYVLPEYDPWLL